MKRLPRTRFLWLVGGILAIGIGVNAMLWFRPRPAAATLALPSYPTAQVAAGRDIFQATCAVCHGLSGGGDAAAGVPALDGSMHAWHHPDSQIADFLRNGVGRMPAVGADWSDDEIDAVLAYLKQWWEPEQLAWQTKASRQNP